MSRRLPRTSLINHSPGWSLHRKQASRTEDQVLVLRPASGQTTPGRNCGGDGVVVEVTGGGSCCTAMGAAADRPRNSIESSLKGVEKFSLSPHTLPYWSLPSRVLQQTHVRGRVATCKSIKRLVCLWGPRGGVFTARDKTYSQSMGVGNGTGTGFELRFWRSPRRSVLRNLYTSIDAPTV